MNKIHAIGIKVDGKAFRVINRVLLDAELSGLPKGKYRLIVEKLRRNKSNPQLAWLFGQIYPLVLQGFLDTGWDNITNLDQVDAKMKEMFARTEIVNKHTGEIMSIPALKRDMTTVEMMTFVQAIREWAEDYLNVTIPDPGTNFNLNFDEEK
jgi:hypothetical protein